MKEGIVLDFNAEKVVVSIYMLNISKREARDNHRPHHQKSKRAKS